MNCTSKALLVVSLLMVALTTSACEKEGREIDKTLNAAKEKILAFTTAACAQKDTAEKIGREIDTAVTTIKKITAFTEAARQKEGSAEKAGKYIDKTLNSAKETINEATR